MLPLSKKHSTSNGLLRRSNTTWKASQNTHPSSGWPSTKTQTVKSPGGSYCYRASRSRCYMALELSTAKWITSLTTMQPVRGKGGYCSDTGPTDLFSARAPPQAAAVRADNGALIAVPIPTCQEAKGSTNTGLRGGAVKPGTAGGKLMSSLWEAPGFENDLLWSGFGDC